MSILSGFSLISNVSNVDGDSSGLFFRSLKSKVQCSNENWCISSDMAFGWLPLALYLIDLIIVNEPRLSSLCKNFSDGCCQRCFPVVHVTNSSDIDVRLRRFC